MSTYLLFFLLGLGGGSVYAILGLGLVLKYRSAGVVDFAQGAVAMYGAYVFIGLRTSGVLELPWIIIPHQITLSSRGLPAVWALLITLVYGAVLGVVLYQLVYRPLLRAAPLTKVCASVGVMLSLEAIAVLNFGTTPTSAPSVLPTGSFVLAGIVVPVSQLYLAGIVIVAAAALAAAFRYSRFGLATRAGAENDVGAALIGLSANRIAAQNWVIATVLATLSGVLIAPISEVNPTSYTLFVVPALGAALIGRFSSFGATAAAGLALGVVQSEIVHLQTVFTWLPQQGLGDGVPFVLILVVMTLSAERVRGRGVMGHWRNPSIGRPARPVVTAALTFVIGVAAMILLHGSDRVALMASVVWVCLCLSLVVLTGYVGQVSLAQMSFAGISAFMLSHLSENWGVPFPFSLLLAAAAAVPVGLLIGLPALRVRGVNLAVITLAAAAAIDALVFNPAWFSGGLGGRTVPPPTIFGLNLGVAGDNSYPRVVFGVFLLVIVTLVGLSVARMRGSATGRMLIAVRSNERAAAAAGIRVAPAKLFAFALSAFIAGLGGGLLGYLQGTVSAPTFATFTSLTLLAIAYVAGIGRVAGAVIAGLLMSANGLFVNFLNEHLSIGQYQTIVAGIALALTAIKNPDGVASELASATRGPGRWLGAVRDRVVPVRWAPGPGTSARPPARPTPPRCIQPRPGAAKACLVDLVAIQAVPGGHRRAAALFPGHDPVAQHAHVLDLSLHHVAWAQVELERVRLDRGDPRDGPGGQDVPGAEPLGRVERDELRHGQHHAAGVALLPDIPVHPQLHGQVVGVRDLVLGDDPGADRAERVDGLAEREHPGLHLPALDVAGGDVVEDRVARDVIRGLVGAEELAGLADDDGQLELVVELVGQVLGVDDRVVRADDRVHVLEEHDALVHRVGPVDLGQFLVVLGEVPRGVEELLRRDGGAQPHRGERKPVPGLGDVPAALEVLPGQPAVQLDHRVAVNPPGPALVERHQFHMTKSTISGPGVERPSPG